MAILCEVKSAEANFAEAKNVESFSWDFAGIFEPLSQELKDPPCFLKEGGDGTLKGGGDSTLMEGESPCLVGCVGATEGGLQKYHVIYVYAVCYVYGMICCRRWGRRGR